MSAELLIAIRRADQAAKAAAIARTNRATFGEDARPPRPPMMVFAVDAAILLTPILMIAHLVRGNWGKKV